MGVGERGGWSSKTLVEKQLHALRLLMRTHPGAGYDHPGAGYDHPGAPRPAPAAFHSPAGGGGVVTGGAVAMHPLHQALQVQQQQQQQQQHLRATLQTAGGPRHFLTHNMAAVAQHQRQQHQHQHQQFMFQQREQQLQLREQQRQQTEELQGPAILTLPELVPFKAKPPRLLTQSAPAAVAAAAATTAAAAAAAAAATAAATATAVATGPANPLAADPSRAVLWGELQAMIKAQTEQLEATKKAIAEAQGLGPQTTEDRGSKFYDDCAKPET